MMIENNHERPEGEKSPREIELENELARLGQLPSVQKRMGYARTEESPNQGNVPDDPFGIEALRHYEEDPLNREEQVRVDSFFRDFVEGNSALSEDSKRYLKMVNQRKLVCEPGEVERVSDHEQTIPLGNRNHGERKFWVNVSTRVGVSSFPYIVKETGEIVDMSA